MVLEGYIPQNTSQKYGVDQRICRQDHCMKIQIILSALLNKIKEIHLLILLFNDA